MRCCFCFCAAGINDDHPTSENGKLAAFASGRPAFREHAKHAEGSDTTPTSYTQRVLSAGCTSHNSDKSKKRLRSPAGPRRLGTATRISASLLRRLSVFFESTPDQDPKAAKYTFLIPGPGMFVNVRNAPRVVIPPPTQNTTCFAVCALVCDFSPKAECVPTFTRESERGAFV